MSAKRWLYLMVGAGVLSGVLNNAGNPIGALTDLIVLVSVVGLIVQFIRGRKLKKKSHPINTTEQH